MKKRQAGFSLVEVMMVISVTIFLSLLAISYNRSTDIQILLFRDQSTVVSILNRAKSLAIEKFYKPGSIACAFGVHFDEISQDFTLFQDFGGGDCSSTDFMYDAGLNPSEQFEVFTLDRRLSFNLFEEDPATDISGPADISFIPPHLVTISTAEFPVTIRLEATNGTSVDIEVSASGQITTTD